MTLLLLAILGACGTVWVFQGMYIFLWGVVRLIRNMIEL